MYAKILVPVDGSQASNAGLTEAIKIAKSQGSEIRLDACRERSYRRSELRSGDLRLRRRRGASQNGSRYSRWRPK